MILVLVLAYAGTVGGFLIYLNRLNERTDKERQSLLNRIQAPETLGVTLDIPDGPGHIGVGLEGVEDDQAWEKYRELTS